MYSKTSAHVILAIIATTALSAPANVGKREPTTVTCTPNSQGVSICCDQFGGCEPQDEIFDPLNIANRSPTTVTCTPNSQGVSICCDQFGGCEPRDELSDPSARENRLSENNF